MGFAVLVWRRETALIAAQFISRKRNPDQAAWMDKLIWVFGVLMWRRDISHDARHLFFLSFLIVYDGMTEWLGNIQLCL